MIYLQWLTSSEVLLAKDKVLLVTVKVVRLELFLKVIMRLDLVNWM